jgi:FMN-dependent NADH-azoreductase
MSKLLHIKASPRGAESKSSAVASAYVAALRERLPELSVDTLDLAKEKISDFDGDKVAARMAVMTGQTNHGPRPANRFGRK